MLLRRIWEAQQEQERQQAGAAGAEGGTSEAEGAAAAQQIGMVQQQLVEWYIEQQLHR